MAITASLACSSMNSWGVQKIQIQIPVGQTANLVLHRLTFGPDAGKVGLQPALLDAGVAEGGQTMIALQA